MFDTIFQKFEKELKKEYPDYQFYITDDLEAEDFIINSVICEISNIKTLQCYTEFLYHKA